MNVYTYTEARQKLAKVLDQAAEEGEVRIKRQDGRVFVVKVQQVEKSPLDVAGIDLGISTGEILKYIEEGRRVDRIME
jgi:hypothetical protein